MKVKAPKKVNVSGRVCITRYEVYQANFCRKLRIPMKQMFMRRKKKSRKWEEEEEDLGYCCPITVEKVNMPVENHNYKPDLKSSKISFLIHVFYAE